MALKSSSTHNRPEGAVPHALGHLLRQDGDADPSPPVAEDVAEGEAHAAVWGQPPGGERRREDDDAEAGEDGAVPGVAATHRRGQTDDEAAPDRAERRGRLGHRAQPGEEHGAGGDAGVDVDDDVEAGPEEALADAADHRQGDEPPGGAPPRHEDGAVQDPLEHQACLGQIPGGEVPEQVAAGDVDQVEEEHGDRLVRHHRPEPALVEDVEVEEDAGDGAGQGVQALHADQGPLGSGEKGHPGLLAAPDN
jgi:hypothetical protein